MPGIDAVISGVDAFTREAILFAAIGFLIGGIDDLVVDLVFLWSRLCRWWRPEPRRAPVRDGGRMAVFVPAWDEARVIGPMLRTTLARYAYADYRIYVGVYPNDPATAAEVSAVAVEDDRVRMVVNPRPGGTTKADCLNAIWRALLRDETEESPVRAIVLHDAEDLVHPDELGIMAAWLADHHAVQIPVLPLSDPRSPLVSGHYLDEFSEAHCALPEVRALTIQPVRPARSIRAADRITYRQQHGHFDRHTCLIREAVHQRVDGLLTPDRSGVAFGSVLLGYLDPEILNRVPPCARIREYAKREPELRIGMHPSRPRAALRALQNAQGMKHQTLAGDSHLRNMTRTNAGVEDIDYVYKMCRMVLHRL